MDTLSSRGQASLKHPWQGPTMPSAKGVAKESERDKNISQQAGEIQPNKEQRDVVTKMLVRLLKVQEKPDDAADAAASNGFEEPTTQLLERQEQFSEAQIEHRESTRGVFPWRSARQGITKAWQIEALGIYTRG